MSAKGKEIVGSSTTAGSSSVVVPSSVVGPLTLARPLTRAIGVLGGINLGNKEEFNTLAQELGKMLAARNFNVVYGGGLHDLSGIVALNAAARGSHVLGITLYDFSGRNNKKFTVGTEFKVLSMPERVAYMLQNVNAFIALPGGLDTLELVSSVMSWAQLNLHQKPIGFLNVNGFYDGILAFLQHAAEHKFIPQTTLRLVAAAPRIDQLIDQLQLLMPTPLVMVSQPVQMTEEDQKRERTEPDTEEENKKGKRREPNTDLRL